MNLLESGYFYKEVLTYKYDSKKTYIQTLYKAADGNYVFYKANSSTYLNIYKNRILVQNKIKAINLNNTNEITESILELCPQINLSLIKMLYGLK